jgi:hypothetical protein
MLFLLNRPSARSDASDAARHAGQPLGEWWLAPICGAKVWLSAKELGSSLSRRAFTSITHAGFLSAKHSYSKPPLAHDCMKVTHIIGAINHGPRIPPAPI